MVQEEMPGMCGEIDKAYDDSFFKAIIKTSSQSILESKMKQKRDRYPTTNLISIPNYNEPENQHEHFTSA